eukprot:TRINITY_DN8377_c0_g2_i1.p1 TRINITY_DN8377_c0_g2~~TRINITY_DN8377_c0_g2_i1.p1  ORF type:complete len:424 (-),score=41.44 TRINITY_DN8377_c0_g2_i1:500-1771(-)
MDIDHEHDNSFLTQENGTVPPTIPRTRETNGTDHNDGRRSPLIDKTPQETNKLRIRLAFADLRPSDELIMRNVSNLLRGIKVTKPLEMQPVSSQAVIIQTADPEVFKTLLAVAEVDCGGKLGAMSNERDPRHVLSIRALPIGATREDVVKALGDFFYTRNTHRPTIGAFLARYALAFGWAKADKEIPRHIYVLGQKCLIEVRPFTSGPKPRPKPATDGQSTQSAAPWGTQTGITETTRIAQQTDKARDFPTPAEAMSSPSKARPSDGQRRFLTVRSLSPRPGRAAPKAKEGTKIRLPVRLITGAKTPTSDGKDNDKIEANRNRPQAPNSMEIPDNMPIQEATQTNPSNLSEEAGRHEDHMETNTEHPSETARISEAGGRLTTSETDSLADDREKLDITHAGSEAALKKLKLPVPNQDDAQNEA